MPRSETNITRTKERRTYIQQNLKGLLLPYPTIVNAIQTNLMSTISDADVGTDVTICISDLGDKSMDAFILALYIELREDHCVRRML